MMVGFVYLRSLAAGWHDAANWLCPLLRNSSSRELDSSESQRGMGRCRVMIEDREDVVYIR